MPPGVEVMDHTADVGVVIRARSLPDLFRAAAAGLIAVVEEEEGRVDEYPLESVEPARIVLTAPEPAILLVRWLRELLHLYEVRRLAFVGADFESLSATELSATVRFRPAGTPAREVKGVTYHRLELTDEGGEWSARVVFDV